MSVYFYTPLVPQGAQQKNVTQPIMEQNFQAINETIMANHVGFNSVNTGIHSFIQFQDLTASPPVFAGFEGFWNKVSSTTNKNEIYTNTSNFASGSQQSNAVTASVLSYSTPALNGAGWTSLPSGIVMKWGVGSVTSGVNPGNTFTLPVSGNIPAFTQVYNCQITPLNTTAIVSLVSVQTTLIVATATVYPAPFFYLIIGTTGAI